MTEAAVRARRGREFRKLQLSISLHTRVDLIDFLPSQHIQSNFYSPPPHPHPTTTTTHPPTRQPVRRRKKREKKEEKNTHKKRRRGGKKSISRTACEKTHLISQYIPRQTRASLSVCFYRLTPELAQCSHYVFSLTAISTRLTNESQTELSGPYITCPALDSVSREIPGF